MFIEFRLIRRDRYDPKLAMIAALRADPSTFLEDPREPNAPPHEYNPDEKVDTKSPLLQRAEVRFQTFRTEFNMAEHAGQISRILNEDLEMKRMLERIGGTVGKATRCAT